MPQKREFGPLAALRRRNYGHRILPPSQKNRRRRFNSKKFLMLFGEKPWIFKFWTLHWIYIKLMLTDFFQFGGDTFYLTMEIRLLLFLIILWISWDWSPAYRFLSILWGQKTEMKITLGQEIRRYNEDFNHSTWNYKPLDLPWRRKYLEVNQQLLES